MILKEGLTIFFGREDLNLAWVALVKPNHTSFWALLIIYLILKVEYLVYCEVTYCSNKQEHMWWKYCKHSKCFFIWLHIDLHKYFQDLARGKKEFRGIIFFAIIWQTFCKAIAINLNWIANWLYWDCLLFAVTQNKGGKIQIDVFVLYERDCVSVECDYYCSFSPL